MTKHPVIRFKSLRKGIALKVQNDIKLHQMDITTSFLNGEIREEVYMKKTLRYILSESLVYIKKT